MQSKCNQSMQSFTVVGVIDINDNIQSTVPISHFIVKIFKIILFSEVFALEVWDHKQPHVL